MERLYDCFYVNIQTAFHCIIFGCIMYTELKFFAFVFQVLLAMQRKELSGNLHFTSPNPEIPALVDGRIKVPRHLHFKCLQSLILRVSGISLK